MTTANDSNNFESWLESQLADELGPLTSSTPPTMARGGMLKGRPRVSFRHALAIGTALLALGGGSAAAATQLAATHSGNGSGQSRPATVKVSATKHADPRGTARAETPEATETPEAIETPRPTAKPTEAPGDADGDEGSGAVKPSADPSSTCPPDGGQDRACGWYHGPGSPGGPNGGGFGGGGAGGPGGNGGGNGGGPGGGGGGGGH